MEGDEEKDRVVRIRLLSASLELTGDLLLGICIFAERQADALKKNTPQPVAKPPNLIPLKKAM